MTEENFQNFIEKTFNDQITTLLLKNSNLTTIQFETLVIDLLTDLISDEKLTIYQKTLFRHQNISRGSFSRSLQQARRNVIKSIFTVVLLSYIGVFKENPFDDYFYLSEKLHEYLSIIESTQISERKTLLDRIEHELVDGINDLATPRSIKVT